MTTPAPHFSASKVYGPNPAGYDPYAVTNDVFLGWRGWVAVGASITENPDLHATRREAVQAIKDRF